MQNHPFENTYVVCTRRARRGRFEAEPGPTSYLRVPNDRDPCPGDRIGKRAWLDEVNDRADGVADKRIDPGGDVLVFVHGYNNDQEIVMMRHRRLQADLWAEGFRGLVVSLDWPSNDKTLNYLEDRWDASETAIELVTGCAVPLAARQKSGCGTNVHLLGHSTGAYVIREAFYHARKKGALHRSDWKVSQVAFVGGDIASASLAGTTRCRARCLPGRCGLPTTPIDTTRCSRSPTPSGSVSGRGSGGWASRRTPILRWSTLTAAGSSTDSTRRRRPRLGTFCHSWHIGNRVFARDLACVLQGGIDRAFIPTRRRQGDALVLRDAPRSAHESRWLEG